MQGKKAFWQGQLTGLKTLPTESGAWGVLLPRPKDKKKLHEPDAAEFVDAMDVTLLTFDTRDIEDMNRGYGLALGSWVALLGFIITAPILIHMYARPAGTNFLDHLATLIVVSFFAPFIVWAYRSARAPFREPFMLVRKLRRFYVWVDKKQGWQHWDYDSLVPFTQVNKLVTGAGASTIFALRLALIDPVTREIKQTLSPAPIQRTPEQCGQIWEFIRCYMDGKPEDLPPVRSRPSILDKTADLVRFDRRFTGVITADHRFEPGIFPKLFFSFWAVFDYWQMRAMAWIQRSAPRPAMPPELAAAMAADGPNPYRFIAPTADEQLALQGKLPRLRWRWAVAAVFATALHGGLFLFMSYGILSTLWEK